ncbi:16S rRNA (cytidine(1402)-2'-O)-methyltransferase [Rhodomicrobium sp. Az07]|uniref:16S rRNA (cytidine(1402)-2'-O)-methyltransferase n=1 Tax=Rhodomicrobium sp. Az07 TaxID=2839034 RepID=UPI001BE7044D|nr:16S rRNA (cytidine(1402)-2'-O)-methyltransferase [Rhodomicrobium sp. Az07]MBT3071933.1 16S rRNA (cytidine(1402)-2'-O)-methyltransferase [Rhodomicrobium sp. Az07]
MTKRRPPKNPQPDAVGDARSAIDAERAAALLAAVSRQFDKLNATPLDPGLFLVSTPIGNLSDISIRVLFVLASADRVYCEDTRHSRKLFSAFDIGRKLETYHDFSGESDRERILDALREGKSVALISDAGTPLIADPGYKLVRDAVSEGVRVFPVPGASAILSALVASGLPTDRFFFGGFLPQKDGARLEALEAMRAVPGTLVFYETPSRIEAALAAIETVYPERTVAVARELTKLHETIAKGTARDLAAAFEVEPPQGEIVLLIAPGEAVAATEADVENALRAALKTVTLKEAVEDVSKGLGVAKKMAYNLALKIKGEAS